MKRNEMKTGQKFQFFFLCVISNSENSKGRKCHAEWVKYIFKKKKFWKINGNFDKLL